MQNQPLALFLLESVFDLDELLFAELNVVNLADVGSKLIDQVVLGVISIDLVQVVVQLNPVFVYF